RWLALAEYRPVEFRSQPQMNVARIIGKANASPDELLAEGRGNIAGNYQLSLATVCLPDHSVHKASVQV
ncbi:MAG TPA: hypothetical protein VFC21_04930, partial [Bryobacteraceae bacterium]|nr:hypothetical protein [Bryobacteraceae bacterium]